VRGDPDGREDFRAAAVLQELLGRATSRWTTSTSPARNASASAEPNLVVPRVGDRHHERVRTCHLGHCGRHRQHWSGLGVLLQLGGRP
jgi:hypothetical protein